MNKVILSGRITKDLELKLTANGKRHVNFTLAVDKGYGDNKKTLWINCVAWEKTAEIMADNLGKGRKIMVEGELDQYQVEKDGQKRNVDQVLVRNFEFMDSKKEQAQSGFESMGTEVELPPEFDF